MNFYRAADDIVSEPIEVLGRHPRTLPQLEELTPSKTFSIEPFWSHSSRRPLRPSVFLGVLCVECLQIQLARGTDGIVPVLLERSRQEQGADHHQAGEKKRYSHAERVHPETGDEGECNARHSAEGVLNAHVQPPLNRWNDSREHRRYAWKQQTRSYRH